MVRTRSLAVLLMTAVTVVTMATAPSTGAAGKSENWPPSIALPNGWRPEGITAGRGTSLYVGSLANGAIWKTDARTGEGGVLSPGATGMVSVGIDYEQNTNRLWVAGGPTGQIRVVNADTGAILQTYPVAGTGFLNDVAVTKEAVYVTDSSLTRSLLVVIPLQPNGDLPPSTAATILPLTNGARGNGIVEFKQWLVIVQSATGLLFKVDPTTGAATPIDLGGYLVTNGDGLELQGNTLYVVRNRSNVIAKIKLDSHLESGQVLGEITDPGLDVPSTVALQAGRLWAVNARFGTPSPSTATFTVTQLNT